MSHNDLILIIYATSLGLRPIFVRERTQIFTTLALRVINHPP